MSNQSQLLSSSDQCGFVTAQQLAQPGERLQHIRINVTRKWESDELKFKCQLIIGAH